MNKYGFKEERDAQYVIDNDILFSDEEVEAAYDFLGYEA